MDIAIIGAGISGVSLGRLVNEKYNITIYDKENQIGGLIKCINVHGNLYHQVGGHVFNSKNKDVLNWFWKFFNKENEFYKITRNAKILIEKNYIGYPIENHLFELEYSKAENIVNEIVSLRTKSKSINLEEFFINNFGRGLFELYFKPYNKKIWQMDLKEISLDWLYGKLPMPSKSEIIKANIFRTNEKKMVHSSFYYPVENGSQYIINRIAEDLNIRKSTLITSIEYNNKKWIINKNESYDKVVFTGNLKLLHDILFIDNDKINKLLLYLKRTLMYNGTSNVLCECDKTKLSWLYLPDSNILAHRIIYTGNFSKNNNAKKNRISCVVEFSGYVNEESITNEIKKLPGNLKIISYNYHDYSYIIKTRNITNKISALKNLFNHYNLFLLGRFAEWEYYNMDKCIEASMKLARVL